MTAVNAAPEELVITTMTMDDLDKVMQVEKASFTTPWSRQAFVRELTENAFAVYVVGRLGTKVVGYAGMWLIINEAHVTNIAVHPDYRRRHFGERLLQELIDRAKRNNCDRMTLEVRTGNLGARAMYRRFGFVEQGIRRRYYTDTGEDAIIMWKDEL